MKKILLVLALMMNAVIMMAEDEHLKFKGVPIDGTLESVTQKLEMLGFTRGELLENVQILHGVFAGYKGNRMNEANPHKKWAKMILAKAEIFGVTTVNTII